MAGWICPKCKGEKGTLFIRNAQTDVQIYDDGAEAVGDLEWDSDAQADCTCGWKGTAGQAAKAAEDAEAVVDEGEEAQ